MGEIIRWPARQAPDEPPFAATLANAPERQFSCIAEIIGQLEQMVACLQAGIAALPEGDDRDRLQHQRAAIDGEILRAHRQLDDARGAFGAG